MTLAGEDTISELVNVVTVADANAEECVDDILHPDPQCAEFRERFSKEQFLVPT